MEDIFVEKHKKECTGCRCCQQLCPGEAIAMINDEEGFLYPMINKDICIYCGLCEERCPVISEESTDIKRLERPLVYAASNNDSRILQKSSSGGIFSVLAELVLNKGGVVVGCIFDDALNPIHIVANNKNEITKMRGSKYIQSDTLTTFRETEKVLESGKWVLYTGTPCQIAGLRAYLGAEYEQLLTVDLVCHGVPSNALFKAYLDWLERKINGKVIEYRFRDKKMYGWGSTGSFTYLKDGKTRTKQLLPERDYYYYYYLKGDIYRESCYVCKFASPDRQGDITIADYWGIQKYHSEFYPPQGVSMVLVNTKKGEQIFNQIVSSIKCIPSKLEYSLESNGNLQHPSPRPNTRDIIYRNIKKMGFEAAVKKHYNPNRIIPAVKRTIPYEVKVIIKRLFNHNQQPSEFKKE